jgi:hypothetical protein
MPETCADCDFWDVLPNAPKRGLCHANPRQLAMTIEGRVDWLYPRQFTDDPACGLFEDKADG